MRTYLLNSYARTISNGEHRYCEMSKIVNSNIREAIKNHNIKKDISQYVEYFLHIETMVKINTSKSFYKDRNKELRTENKKLATELQEVKKELWIMKNPEEHQENLRKFREKYGADTYKEYVESLNK